MVALVEVINTLPPQTQEVFLFEGVEVPLYRGVLGFDHIKSGAIEDVEILNVLKTECYNREIVLRCEGNTIREKYMYRRVKIREPLEDHDDDDFERIDIPTDAPREEHPVIFSMDTFEKAIEKNLVPNMPYPIPQVSLFGLAANEPEDESIGYALADSLHYNTYYKFYNGSRVNDILSRIDRASFFPCQEEQGEKLIIGGLIVNQYRDSIHTMQSDYNASYNNTELNQSLSINSIPRAGNYDPRISRAAIRIFIDPVYFLSAKEDPLSPPPQLIYDLCAMVLPQGENSYFKFVHNIYGYKKKDESGNEIIIPFNIIAVCDGEIIDGTWVIKSLRYYGSPLALNIVNNLVCCLCSRDPESMSFYFGEVKKFLRMQDSDERSNITQCYIIAESRNHSVELSQIEYNYLDAFNRHGIFREPTYYKSYNGNVLRSILMPLNRNNPEMIPIGGRDGIAQSMTSLSETDTLNKDYTRSFNFNISRQNMLFDREQHPWAFTFTQEVQACAINMLTIYTSISAVINPYSCPPMPKYDPCLMVLPQQDSNYFKFVYNIYGFTSKPFYLISVCAGQFIRETNQWVTDSLRFYGSPFALGIVTRLKELCINCLNEDVKSCLYNDFIVYLNSGTDNEERINIVQCYEQMETPITDDERAYLGVFLRGGVDKIARRENAS